MEILFAYVTWSKVESKINLDTSVLLRNKKWEGEKEKNVENKYDIYIYMSFVRRKNSKSGNLSNVYRMRGILCTGKTIHS